jgi:hypothetical protein
MFGLTTTRRLRAAQHELEFEAASRWTAESNLAFENQAIAELSTATLRDRYHYRHRIAQLLARCSQYRTLLRHEKGTVRVLAEQLLDATSGRNPAARAALGLPETSPWDRAVEGLNALVDAGVAVDRSSILRLDGPERIEWNYMACRWHLVTEVAPDFAPLDDAPAEVPHA